MVGNSADEHPQKMSLRRLILEASTSVINLDTRQIDGEIEAALARINASCDVDRAYVFALGDETMSNTYEWCSPGDR